MARQKQMHKTKTEGKGTTLDRQDYKPEHNTTHKTTLGMTTQDMPRTQETTTRQDNQNTRQD